MSDTAHFKIFRNSPVSRFMYWARFLGLIGLVAVLLPLPETTESLPGRDFVLKNKLEVTSSASRRGSGYRLTVDDDTEIDAPGDLLFIGGGTTLRTEVDGSGRRMGAGFVLKLSSKEGSASQDGKPVRYFRVRTASGREGFVRADETAERFVKLEAGAEYRRRPGTKLSAAKLGQPAIVAVLGKVKDDTEGEWLHCMFVPSGTKTYIALKTGESGETADAVRAYYTALPYLAKSQVAKVTQKKRIVWTGLLMALPILLLRLLAPLSLVFAFFVPALFLRVVYALAGTVIYIVNALHAVVVGRNHEESVRYMVQWLNFDTKLNLTTLGLLEAYPHIDLFAAEAQPLPYALALRVDSEVPRPWAVARCMGVVAVAALPWLIVALALSVALSMVTPVFWVLTAIQGARPRGLFHFMESVLRFRLKVLSFLLGLSNRLPDFRLSADPESSPDEADAEMAQSGLWDESPAGCYSPRTSDSLEMNVISLALLVLFSGGLYQLLWVSRVARRLGQDALTITVIAVIFASLPLGFIYARFYRKIERHMKNEPSILQELLMLVPFLNLIVAPLFLQLIFNEYEALRRRTAARQG